MNVSCNQREREMSLPPVPQIQIKSIKLVACSNVHILMTLIVINYVVLWKLYQYVERIFRLNKMIRQYNLCIYLNNISSIESCPLLRVWRIYDQSHSTSFVKLGQRHIAWNYPFLFHPILPIKFASRIPLLHLHFSPDWWPNIHLI